MNKINENNQHVCDRLKTNDIDPCKKTASQSSPESTEKIKIMEELEKISYFANANLHENDQETFLMWCFDCLKSKNKTIKTLSRELIYLFLGSPDEFDENDIDELSGREHVAYRQIAIDKKSQKGRIDIIATFRVKDENVVLVIEHKVLSRRGNDFTLYKEIAKDYYKNLNIKEIKYCFLDPFYTKRDEEIKNNFIIIRDEYCSLLEKYSESIPFVKDYYSAYFCDFSSPINSLSRNLQKRFCYIYSDGGCRATSPKEITIEYKGKIIIVKILAWYLGKYFLKINDKNLLTELRTSGIVIDDQYYNSKGLVYSDITTLKIIDDLKKVCERSLDFLKEMTAI